MLGRGGTGQPKGSTGQTFAEQRRGTRTAFLNAEGGDEQKAAARWAREDWAANGPKSSRGQNLFQQDQATQTAFLNAEGGDPAKAAARWAREDSQNNAPKSVRGQTLFNQDAATQQAFLNAEGGDYGRAAARWAKEDTANNPAPPPPSAPPAPPREPSPPPGNDAAGAGAVRTQGATQDVAQNLPGQISERYNALMPFLKQLGDAWTKAITDEPWKTSSDVYNRAAGRVSQGARAAAEARGMGGNSGVGLSEENLALTNLSDAFAQRENTDKMNWLNSAPSFIQAGMYPTGAVANQLGQTGNIAGGGFDQWFKGAYDPLTLATLQKWGGQ